jgi:hypothetical protein
MENELSVKKLPIFEKETKRKKSSKLNIILQAFSPWKNIKNLLSFESSGPDTIECLSGIRALSALALVLFHSYYFRLITPFRDDRMFYDWKTTSWANTVSQLNAFVESFFVMSGILTTRSILKDLEK